MSRLLPLILVIIISCKEKEPNTSSYVAFTGAVIIDGSGKTPIQNGTLLLSEGRVMAVGSQEAIDIPENTQIHDVSGKTIIPGIINAHGHVGDVKGIEGGHYSNENTIDNLSIYARYGVTTVVSLGGERIEAEPLRAVNDTTAGQRARLFIAGEVIDGDTPAEALAVVEKNHKMGVDFMKIRVDDNLGTIQKMPEDVYKAVINRSHELGYKISTHMYYLEDAKKLLEAGSDMMAHSVRDVPVDTEFIALLKEKNISYCPTLTRELSTYIYGEEGDFFDDPFFSREYDSATVRPLRDPEYKLKIRNSLSAQTYKKQLPVAMSNLKTLSDAGIPIIFGTDSGIPTRFMGYFEHLEMELMADSGLTPMQIIVSATKIPAEYLNLKDLGTLSQGHWADFVILDADPLEDIKNVRHIHKVFIGGEEINR
ncbi:amidohydrolase family protein [Gelidibacter maritimus]|uniref:Amidohydrolase family protein n=1 Tax=Gelidibacter maritimus TaxID=2761487 RepID=A0A7W2M2M8_9FLAO|nr:amidohydrolase family protein [Gelidibacter maritimus]MBA6151535.1 amidohydrolase family protein [Gelidibacter maritimus]